MEREYKAVSQNDSSTQQKNVDELMKENLELMYNIQKNRSNFCQLVGGC
jgi:hypothetical protein